MRNLVLTLCCILAAGGFPTSGTQGLHIETWRVANSIWGQAHTKKKYMYICIHTYIYMGKKLERSPVEWSMPCALRGGMTKPSPGN